jgi:hypothetical protein
MSAFKQLTQSTVSCKHWHSSGRWNRNERFTGITRAICAGKPQYATVWNKISLVSILQKDRKLDETTNHMYHSGIPVLPYRAMSIQVAARSKATFCGRSLATIACWNPAASMILLSLLCVVCLIYLGQADHSSRGVKPSMCMCHWVWSGAGMERDVMTRKERNTKIKVSLHLALRYRCLLWRRNVFTSR